MAMKSDKFYTEGNAMICLPVDILDHRRELVEVLRGVNAPPLPISFLPKDGFLGQ